MRGDSSQLLRCHYEPETQLQTVAKGRKLPVRLDKYIDDWDANLDANNIAEFNALLNKISVSVVVVEINHRL